MDAPGIKKFAIGIIGIILFGTAIFAEQIGIDNDSRWGHGRIIIFGLGILLISVNLLTIIFQNKLLKLAKHTSDLFNKFNEIDYSTQLNFFSIIASFLVIAIYIWFFLPFFKLSPTTDFYSQLAIAFKGSQLYLPEQPPPSLLSLSDPYDYESRKQIDADFTWDVSFYKGRFYMYWGPVPSLILTAFSNGQLARIGDQYVFFIFLCGLFFYSAIFIGSFWRRFNHNLPNWIIGISLLAIGLSAPTIWMLIKPRVYEAAVVGCQFFFIGGCYWAYSAIRNDPPNLWKLALASSHWALALGTRITILPAIIFISGLTLFYILKDIKKATLNKMLLTSSVMGIPLLIAIAGLGLYNWLRFDSIFEFGIRYQLANVNYTKFTNSFSTSYVNENLLNYFIHPFKIQAKFPYLRAVEDVASNERLAGLLYTTPYFLFILMSVCRFLYATPTSKKNPGVNQNISARESWLVFALTGSSLISLAIVLTFYFAALRYAEDFLPALLLLATICLGQGYDLFSGSRMLRKLYILLVVLLVAFSVVVSILIAIPIDRTGFMLLVIKLVQQYFGLR